MQGSGRRHLVAGIAIGMMLVLAGCSFLSDTPAPVEDRSTTSVVMSGSTPAATNSVKSPQGVENLGRPGYYAVRPGDTIMRIGLDTGHNWRDISRWNGLENPNSIEVGQVLRVVPPTGSSPPTGASSGNSSVNGTGVVTRPVTQSTIASGSGVSASGASAGGNVAKSDVSALANSGGDDDINWIWPAQGALVAGFDDVKNKGLDISGKAGDSVVAAADGRVVYAGAGLRSYGQLIILKHNNTYLTAYAHNQALLVKEDQTVQKGQKIAEMGKTDADRVKLHFEIRRQGKPVDPARYLPSR